ncbi:MAG: 30S ribosome-binding factor RbfA [Eubacterium sp.]|nr:30S ribosome-binding factor RbfA [Eubacterium sp.]MBR4241363.1 30S ribosome-binding factor RbfA [Eubacterium sp.]
MPGYRIDRITEDIKRELIHILREVKDPRVSDMISVVKVDVSNDLSYAKIYISDIAGIEKAKESVKGLKAASGFIRKRLSSSLHLRKTPELKFIADDSIEKGFDLFAKLNSLDIPEETEDEN